MRTPPRWNRARRNGVTVIYALVTLAIIGIMLSECARNVITIRRMLDTRQQQLQSSWLARSGIELAIARLSESSKYQGETINLSPDARLEFTVSPITGGVDKYRITCEAKYPIDRPGVVKTKLVRDVHRVQYGAAIRIEFITGANQPASP